MGSSSWTREGSPPRELPRGWEWMLVNVGEGKGSVRENDWPPCGRVIDGSIGGPSLASFADFETTCYEVFVPQHEGGIKVFEQGDDKSFRHGRSPHGKDGSQPDWAGYEISKGYPNPDGKGLPGSKVHFRNWSNRQRTFLLTWPSQTVTHDPWSGE